MPMFVLKRSTLERLNQTRKVCASGFARHAERAKEQEGVVFPDGTVGNGIDTYYPDGLTDEEYLRIAEHDPQHAAWLINNRDVLEAPLPSREVCDAIFNKMLDRRRGRQ